VVCTVGQDAARALGGRAVSRRAAQRRGATEADALLRLRGRRCFWEESDGTPVVEVRLWAEGARERKRGDGGTG
jgi:hypothetical protein